MGHDTKPIDRREFVLTTAAGLAAAWPRRVFGQAAAVRRTMDPVVVASANGNRYKNGGDTTGVEKAFGAMTAGGDVLDALIAGVNIVELDPEDTSVGYGGLPNADGVVQLDASCMHGPRKRAGAQPCPELRWDHQQAFAAHFHACSPFFPAREDRVAAPDDEA